MRKHGFMTIQEEIKNILATFSSETEIPDGASDDEIEELSEYFVELPAEMKEWLRLCNAPYFGGEVFLGVKPAPAFRLIESAYELYPDWEDYEWIPVSQDGCGNYYVLDVSQSVTDTRPVYFIDHEEGSDKPCYIAASGLWEFVRFALEQDLTKDRRFPFDKEFVLAKDPRLESYAGDVPFAWQA
jgi:cell wall assembly regulator SMI1